MQKVITFASLKGGAGKTTASYSAASALSEKYNTMLIDLDPQLSAADIFQTRTKETRLELVALSRTHLEQRLATIKGYDFICLDTPPALGASLRTALSVADLIVLVVKPGYADYFSLMRMQEDLAPHYRKVRILLSQSSNTNLSKEFRQEIEKSGYPVFKTELRNRVAYAECFQTGENVIEAFPATSAAQELKSFVRELRECF